ncbi:hypothetical protein [Tissierella sp. Yu-01]|uniref:hypothetical protein n=1 Tax=Tissierella sp. Yu-01 TaxID=3035694 RepID=UPI00240E2A49|nr:hypothetical protein [Tissierella sp. Yu-01]WFA08969.1 hypothetical protein P3962_14795 [Tissierella sp. Yu-01]
MSLFYHIVTKGKLPERTLLHSRMMHFLLKENANYIYDAKPGYNYYDLTPGVIPSISQSEIDNEVLPLREYFREHEYFIWLIKEFKKLGDFRFIALWEDNSKCATGYYERFFKTCEKKYVTFDEFYTFFESRKAFDEFLDTYSDSRDVLFIVSVK